MKGRKKPIDLKLNSVDFNLVFVGHVLCHSTALLCSSWGEEFQCSWAQLLFHGKDSSHSKQRQQGSALRSLTHFGNEREWQRVLPAFHFTFHTPSLNRKCWTKTAAMFPGSLVGCAQKFSVSYARSQNIGYPAYSFVMLFIPESPFPISTSRNTPPVLPSCPSMTLSFFSVSFSSWIDLCFILCTGLQQLCDN